MDLTNRISGLFDEDGAVDGTVAELLEAAMNTMKAQHGIGSHSVEINTVEQAQAYRDDLNGAKGIVRSQEELDQWSKNMQNFCEHCGNMYMHFESTGEFANMFTTSAKAAAFGLCP